MDERDKCIRQKVSGLDTLPPGTSWRPERGWERLQEQLNAEKAVRRQQRPWYYYAAAAFVILLVPFTVMLSDIREQQARIDRLAAQLKSTQSTPAQPAARPADEELLPPAQVKAPTPAKEEIAAKRAPKVRAGRAKEVLAETQNPAPPDAEPDAALVARQPGSPAATPAGEAEAEKTVPAEAAASRLLRIVSTGPKRKPTSVTFVFEGTDHDTIHQDMLASQTSPSAPVPEKRFLRLFGGSKRQETRAGNSEPPVNILSVLTKNQ